MGVLALSPGERCIDATVGDGGHAFAILEASSPGGRLLVIDADPQALERAERRLEQFASRVTLVNDNFANLESIVQRHHFHPVSCVLMDLGLASWQLDAGGRGFSFSEDSPLDMRLSPTQTLTGAHVVNTYPVEELARVIATYGEEPRARRIARSIVYHRPIRTAFELAKAVEAATPRQGRRIHPATRTFQAVRILVNQELENLESALAQAVRVLAQGGRLAVIAYHSLEDRLVKTFMARESRDCLCPPGLPQCVCSHRATLRTLTKKVVRPSREEIMANPRVRSARLRACVSLGSRLEPDERGVAA
ncbi:MAG: 16S rRNA (cytosine(1402)-N(4))-methyltransferase RsmH [Chloroflexi bacterium]|nr:16S rRNA (cytosine(1402)-N(4))-methyltransferase RsmH [Chloroflexota bacterium]